MNWLLNIIKFIFYAIKALSIYFWCHVLKIPDVVFHIFFPSRLKRLQDLREENCKLKSNIYALEFDLNVVSKTESFIEKITQEYKSPVSFFFDADKNIYAFTGSENSIKDIVVYNNSFIEVACLHYIKQPLDGIDNLYLDYIFVSSAFRRKGIGSRLIEEVKSRFPNHAIDGKFEPQSMADEDVANFYSTHGIQVANGKLTYRPGLRH